jgi:hypothetical protein
MLENEQSPQERFDIVGMLAHEYAYEFDAVGEEWAVRERLRLQPDHPYPYGSLAMFLWMNRDDMTEAIAVGLRAVELSDQTGILPIHSLAVLARVARKAKDWELFGWCLSSLMDGFGSRGGPDIGYERDFIRRLPRSAPDKALYAAFNQFLARRQALRADEEIHCNLSHLQRLEWLAASDADHIATQDELELLERCRGNFGAELPVPDVDNWRDVLEVLVGQGRLHVSLIDQILASLQAEAETVGKRAARARAHEAVEKIKGEDLQRWAKQAIGFVNGIRGKAVGT